MKHRILRPALRTIFRILFKLLARVSVSGSENIPRHGGCLVTINHLGILDAPLLFSLFQRNDVSGLVAVDHRRNLFLHLVVWFVDGIWIDRDRADFGAIKQARAYLKEGGMLGIAPEGTRSDDHQLIQPKSGVAFLADKVDVLILPVAITGTENGLSRALKLTRPKITVTFGEAFHTAPIDRKDREGSLQRNTDEIMTRIAALLPAQYRGVYAHHPRVLELLSEFETALPGVPLDNITLDSP